MVKIPIKSVTMDSDFVASSDEVQSDDASSVDSIANVVEVLSMDLDEEKRLGYLCRLASGEEEVFDRSDLMDGGQMQNKVLRFERMNPPPWDIICEHCGGEGCEECLCDECDRPCRHIAGVNYGCIKHPVV